MVRIALTALPTASPEAWRREPTDGRSFRLRGVLRALLDVAAISSIDERGFFGRRSLLGRALAGCSTRPRAPGCPKRRCGSPWSLRHHFLQLGNHAVESVDEVLDLVVGLDVRFALRSPSATALARPRRSTGRG